MIYHYTILFMYNNVILEHGGRFGIDYVLYVDIIKRN